MIPTAITFTATMILRNRSTMAKLQALFVVFLALLVTVQASIGDKLPEFKDCVKVHKHSSISQLRNINYTS